MPSKIRDENFWEGDPVPVTFQGSIDQSIAFSAVIIGVTRDECGFRSRDERLGKATMESLLRQPMTCLIEHANVTTRKIRSRLMRLEPCRKDPAYLYFGTANFLDPFNVEEFASQAGLILFSEDRPHRPVISRPPPPPSFRK